MSGNYFLVMNTFRLITIMRRFILSLLLLFSVISAFEPPDSAAVPSMPSADSVQIPVINKDTDSTGFQKPDASQLHDTNIFAQPLPSPNNTTNNQKDTTADSTLILLHRDSLIAAESARRATFQPYARMGWSDTIDSRSCFIADATSWYDLPAIKGKFISPHTGIANGMNRLLFYGNTTPVNRIYTGNSIIYQTTSDPVWSHDQFFTNEFSSVTLSSNGDLHFFPGTDALVSPETALFWENGVFGENILSIRFARPVSRNAVMHVFSNYRSFDNVKFSHDANDIYSVFSNLTSDTTVLSHEGYNPLVNEFYCGADLTWKGPASSSFCSIKYADLADEILTDYPPVKDYPALAKLSQYPLTLQSGYATAFGSGYYIDLEVKMQTNHQRWTRSVTADSSTAAQIGIATSDYTAAIRSGITPFSYDSIDITITGQHSKTAVPDSIELTSSRLRPEVRWTHLFKFNHVSGNTHLKAGYDLYSCDVNTLSRLYWYADITAHFASNILSCYIENDHLYLLPSYDSLLHSPILSDTYLRTGVDIMRKWRMISLSAGYQFYPAPNKEAIARSWINGMPPYDQPTSAFVVSSDVNRIFGWALHSRIMITDTRPFYKINAILSYLAFPDLTHEAIDIRLGIDYWSERDSLTFAMENDWGRPVIDINCATSVQIKSFRLFYKIDNLLNRNFSYIPGYHSPGITFRWGFNWFIQR